MDGIGTDADLADEVEKVAGHAEVMADAGWLSPNQHSALMGIVNRVRRVEAGMPRLIVDAIADRMKP